MRIKAKVLPLTLILFSTISQATFPPSGSDFNANSGSGMGMGMGGSMGMGGGMGMVVNGAGIGMDPYAGLSIEERRKTMQAQIMATRISEDLHRKNGTYSVEEDPAEKAARLKSLKEELDRLRESDPEQYKRALVELLNNQLSFSIGMGSYDIDRIHNYFAEKNINIEDITAEAGSEFCKVKNSDSTESYVLNFKTGKFESIPREAYLQKMQQLLRINENLKCKPSNNEADKLVNAKLPPHSKIKKGVERIDKANSKKDCLSTGDPDSYMQAWDVYYGKSRIRVNYASNFDCIDPKKMPEKYVLEHTSAIINGKAEIKEKNGSYRKTFEYGKNNCLYSIEYYGDPSILRKLNKSLGAKEKFYLVPIDI